MCYVPVPGEALTRVQLSEKLEEAKNTVPEKKSTLTEHQFEMKPQSSPRRAKSRWECPSSPGVETTKGRLEARRDRSASPETLVAAEGHAGFHSPGKGEPGKTSGHLSRKPDRSRKSESKATETGVSGSNTRERSSGGGGRSVSPQKHRGSAEAAAGSQEPPDRTTGEQLRGGDGKTGVSRKDTKQKTCGKTEGRSPERQRAAADQRNVPLADSRRNASEEEKTKKSSGELSSRFKTSSLSNIPLLSTERQRRLETQESAALNRHGPRAAEPPGGARDDGIPKAASSSPVKKTPITPGPWRVPSACKVTQTGVAEKRV